MTGQDYFNWMEDQQDKKFETRKKFIRDREKCYLCLFGDWVKSWFY